MANVIVADDEALLRWAVSERLAKEGHSITEADSGATALDALATVPPPTVMVLDVKLPDMSGLTVLSEIRTRRPDVAVVIMTAYLAGEALQEAERLGAHAILAKPVDLDRIAAAVAAASEFGRTRAAGA